LTVSLDVELGRKRADRRKKDTFFALTRKTMRSLSHRVDGLKVEKNWKNGGRWGRLVVYAEEPNLNDDLLSKSVNSLNLIYEALKPSIDAFVGG